MLLTRNLKIMKFSTETTKQDLFDSKEWESTMDTSNVTFDELTEIFNYLITKHGFGVEVSTINMNDAIEIVTTQFQ